ncbi:unnamed protein product [Paramecium pentaurelia]|uniref:Uncharacterized protein n=1 Tax=Paramecium pentaurelia TaxID=43138 RepID=A0A8S1XE95_9CILI|nr:unnamed protein product [Paramecium pentaurelia]
MKMYFEKNIGQIIQLNEEAPQVEISSQSDYVLLPDLKSMVVNFIDLEIDDHNELNLNQSMYTLSSTAASNNIFPVIRQSLIDESFCLNSECEEF